MGVVGHTMGKRLISWKRGLEVSRCTLSQCNKGVLRTGACVYICMTVEKYKGG